MNTAADSSFATLVYVRIAANSLRVCISLVLLWLAAAPASAQVRPAGSCCTITAIGARTGIVTAKENSTGRMFEFKVSDEKVLQSLKIGRGVFANFGSGQVSVDGIRPCCKIVSLDPQPAMKENQGGGRNPATPCCSITGVNAQTGIVAAKENATGRVFSFKVSDANLLKSLAVGQGVYANFATKQVSVDNLFPCGSIISQAPIAGGTDMSKAGSSPNATGKANPATPCCSITSVDAQTGIVAAKEKATGRVFAFKVSDANLLKSLAVGQGVYANFATKQVSVDNASPCCGITELSNDAGIAPMSGAAPGSSPTPTATPGGKTTKPTKPTTVDPKATGTPTVKPNESDTAGAIRGQAAPAPPPGTAAPSAPAAGAPQGRPVPTPPVFSPEKMQVRILSQGKRWRLQTFSGMVGGRLVNEEALYHLVGKEGISESPIPPQIKNELLRDAANSRGNDVIYIVHKNSAERAVARILALGGSAAGAAATTPPSNNVSSTGSSDNGCHDMFGWGNHVNKTASVSFNLPGDLLMLNLNDQSISYANVSGTLKIKAPTSGQLAGEIGLSVLDSFCEPIAFKFRFLHVNGNMDIAPSLDLDAKIGATYQFKTRLAEHHLGGFGFFIGPIPVYIGYDAFLEGRVDVKVPNLAQVKYNVQGNGHGALDAHCDMNGCSATPSVSFNWSTPSGDLTFLAQGVRAVVKPGVLGGVEAYLYNPVFVNAHVGIEPYAKGDFWAYSGSCAEHSGGPADRSYAKALTADIDGGFDVLAGIDASGLAPNGFLSDALLDQEFTVYNWERHVKFYDLIGSTALTPLVKANLPAYATYPEAVQVGMRPCYPYTKDKDGNPLTITYRADWGDGTPESSAQAQGQSDASATHSWAAPGQYNAAFRPYRDSHGREFPTQSTQVAVEVRAGQPSPAGGLRNGNMLVVQPTHAPSLIFQHGQTIDLNPNHLPDLIPSLGQSAPASCSYPPSENCQQACPPYTAKIPMGAKNLTPYGVSGTIQVILKDMSGNTVRTWTVDGLAANGEVYLGFFSYQAQFACPTPGTNTVTATGSSTPPAPNYILSVVPPSGVTELQTNNNSAQIYIRPDATISP